MQRNFPLIGRSSRFKIRVIGEFLSPLIMSASPRLSCMTLAKTLQAPSEVFGRSSVEMDLINLK